MTAHKRAVELRRYESLEAMKDDQARYWQEQPAHARLGAVAQLNEATYDLKAKPRNARRLQRTLVHLER